MSDKWHPLHTALYLWSKGPLEYLLLSCLGDRGEMAHSVEGRTPFLDHVLAEYVMALPPGMKIRTVMGGKAGGMNGHGDGGEAGGVEFVHKYILREAARPFVTDEIYRKVKHPYTAPFKYEIDGPLHRLMRRLVTEENIKELRLVEWRPGMLGGGSVADLVDGAFKEAGEKQFRLVILLAQWVVLGKRFGVGRGGSGPCYFSPTVLAPF